MARTNMDGKPIRRVLEWLLNRDLTDADMAAALDVHPSNYSRHKDDDGYPSFEELARVNVRFLGACNQEGRAPRDRLLRDQAVDRTDSSPIP
jgi:hypothetical protein